MVSSRGRVAKLMDPWVKKRRGRGMALSMTFHKAGKRIARKVHTLVLLAFKSDAPEGKPEARHLDGDFTHNHVDNLEWGSHAENYEDSVRHGTFKLRPPMPGEFTHANGGRKL